MLQALTGDPEARLGTLPEGYWEPIDGTDSENEGEGVPDQTDHEAPFDSPEVSISSGGISFHDFFGSDMVGDAVSTHAMLFPLTGKGTEIQVVA